MAIWWRYDVFNDQMIHEIASTVPTLSKYEKKIGGHQPFWGAMADWRWSCFLQYLHTKTYWRTRGLWTLTHQYDLIIAWKWLKISGCVVCSVRNMNPVKKRFSDVAFAKRTEKRARARVRAEIWKMLEMASNICKTISSWFGAFFYFTRALMH